MKYFICSFVFIILLAARASAGQMTLEQAFDRAIIGNPTVLAVVQRINQAREEVAQARAAYYPSLDLSTSATRKQISRNEDEAGSGLDRTTDTYDGFLSASWTLFDGFSREYTLEAALLAQEQETAGREDLIRTLLASVASSFHTAQLALANRFISESNRDFYAGQLETARIKQEAGVGSLSDVLNFNTSMNQAEIEIEKYTADYDVARTALAALLGMDARGDDLPEPVFPELEETRDMGGLDPESEIAHALAHRPDLNQKELDLKIARSNAEEARSAFYPELSLSGSVGADRTGDARFETDDIENSVGIELTYPLFAGGGDRAALREALYAGTEAELELKNLKNEIISEVRQDCFTVAAARKQLTLYRQNAALAIQNRDMVAKEYEFGTANQVTLNEVQNTLTETRQRIALSLITLRQAWYELKAATGAIHSGRED
ncbi:MAG: TolC family protein [Desulfobacterales bacterium]|nr:TolC family protein [Desulfobacterales bacterium]